MYILFSRLDIVSISDYFCCLDIDCVQGLPLWRESASVVNDELFKGYRQNGGGSGDGKTNEFVAGDLIF